MKQLTFLFLFLFFSSSCASIGKQWQSLIGSDSGEKEAQKTRVYGSSYNQQNNLPPSNYRQYKRTKRKDLEDSAHLESKSGSLWVMEGQGAYLFSQNIVRMIGDPLAVRIEGDPAEQLNAKTKVISKLLAQLEDRRRRALGREPAAGGSKDGEAAKPTGSEANSQKPGQPKTNTNAGGQPSAATGGEENEFSVKTVPTRVVERLVDGNYRVRGTQPFMIGQREYKVIVTGIVRAEDFNEQGIAAPQLLDSNFDIVSSKNSEIR
ncbi:MAG: hypothetical protein A2Z20_12060 [Bdellovibrionales bacterium RBG_16_40_8]|nr:MAG: hypothetical protein A2Z20_12060 [Bdellovibrionales bacterium RBG_16_40_8]